MARKPNYAYERNARARAKAAKREAKRAAKLATRVDGQPEGEALDADGNPIPADAGAEVASDDAPQTGSA